MRRAKLDRQLWWAGLATAAAVWLALAEPWSRGASYLMGDLYHFHLPLRAFYADCLQRGESARWIPEVFCGYYLHGEGQVGQLHPFHQLAYRLLSLVNAFNLELLVNYPLLIAGTYLLLVRRGLPRSAALLAGVLFAYSGFNLTHLLHVNMVAVVAHLPWLLLAIDFVLTDPRPRFVAAAVLLLALVTGSELLLGHPQAVWLVGLVELSYVLLLLTAVLRWWRVPLLAASKLVGVAIGCVQWWPTWQLLGMSRRETTDEAFRGVSSLHPWNFLQTVSPYLFADRAYANDSVQAGSHELSWYTGCVAPILAIWFLVRWKSLAMPRRKLVVWGAALIAVGSVLALGRYASPIHALVVRLPVVGLFRCPGRYGLLMYFGAAVLGGVAMADLLEVVARGERPSWRRIAALWTVPVASLVAAIVVVVVLDAWQGHDASPRWERPLTGVVLTTAAAALVTTALRGQSWALLGLLALAGLDLGVYGISYARLVPPMALADLPASRTRYPRDPQWRITESGQLIRSDAPLLGGARLMYGYVGLFPRLRLLGDPQIATSDPDLLRRLAAVRWKCAEARAVEVEGWLPRARLVAEARVSRDLAADVRRYDPASVALVDEPIELPGELPGEPGRVAITRDRPGAIHCTVDAPAPQLLVLAESWYPGWRVTIGGTAVPIVRTFGDFIGCVVPAGNSHVEFQFDNPVERRAAWVSLGGLLAAILLAGIAWCGARRDERVNPSVAARTRATS
ncbi:MAG: YfhO family protein [Pirellulales bacterium]|nr:YfhO family protein [Pirellulales bacterium]